MLAIGTKTQIPKTPFDRDEQRKKLALKERVEKFAWVLYGT